MLDCFLDPRLAPHPRRVDQREFRAVLREMGVDGVPGRAGNVADDDPILAENLIDQRGFADVRPTDDGNPNLVCVGILVRIVGKVEEIRGKP